MQRRIFLKLTLTQRHQFLGLAKRHEYAFDLQHTITSTLCFLHQRLQCGKLFLRLETHPQGNLGVAMKHNLRKPLVARLHQLHPPLPHEQTKLCDTL